MSNPPTSYDTVLYPGQPLQQTHPDRLATLATLFGMAPAPVERCRVLELGCGDGTNLIPMALALPESSFVGVDLAGRPIARGQQWIEEFGVKNLALRHMDVRDIGPGFGEFDYLIAHGLYSWVPAAVRDKLLAICRGHLSPHGVAFISYNVYPGGHLRQMMRDMMLFHVRDKTEPSERIAGARQFAQFVTEAQAHSEAYGAVLAEERKLVEEHRDGALYHDDLGAINEPVYFHQFADHAGRHGLQYLAEAHFFEMQDSIFPDAVRDAVGKLGDNLIVREQYLDFLKCRRFRQTLLCRREVPLERKLRPTQMEQFHISSSARPVSAVPDIRSKAEEEFRGLGQARMKTGHRLAKAAMVILAEEAPRPLSFDDLLARTGARLGPAASRTDRPDLGEILLGTYAAGLVRLHVYSPALREADERPVVSPLARMQARAGALVTTMFHSAVRVDDPLGRHLIQLLDGTRDRAALVRDLARAVAAGEVILRQDERSISDPGAVRRLLAEQLEPALLHLARLGLLGGSPQPGP